ncbi:MAG: hypothetical protein ACOH2K_00140 [Burkholderiaceae bacterium]
MKRLVLVGGGHAHLSMLQALARGKLADIEVMLVTPNSHQNYSGMPRDQAIAIIREFRATQFDADFADIFIALGEAGRLDHVLGHSDDGIPLQTCPMCGPTLVLRSEHKKGDHVYCRNCGGESALEMFDNRLVASPTGKQGLAADLEPEADTALIARTVRAAVEALPVADLVRASAMPMGNWQ